jgi:hypothetical protein
MANTLKNYKRKRILHVQMRTRLQDLLYLIFKYQLTENKFNIIQMMAPQDLILI